MSLLAAAIILAHSWYPFDCCGDEHCHPVPCEELIAQPDGSVQYGGIRFEPYMVHESLDAHCHVCIPNDVPFCVFLNGQS